MDVLRGRNRRLAAPPFRDTTAAAGVNGKGRTGRFLGSGQRNGAQYETRGPLASPLFHDDLISPQAIRPPASPAGWVMPSSFLA